MTDYHENFNDHNGVGDDDHDHDENDDRILQEIKASNENDN